eukprot:853622_1
MSLFWIYISIVLTIVSIELYKSSPKIDKHSRRQIAFIPNLFGTSIRQLFILPVTIFHLLLLLLIPLDTSQCEFKLSSSYSTQEMNQLFTTKNHRQVLSNKFQTSFTTIVTSKQFQQFIHYYDLSEFRFEILRECHRQDAIDLCCLRLSSKGGSIPSILVNLSEEDGRARFIGEIDHAIKTGLSFVVVHIETNKIAFLSTAFDILDKPELNRDKYSIAMTKRDDFMKEVYMYEPIYAKLRKHKASKDIEYGEIIECAYGCSNPIFNGPKMPLLTALAFMLYFMNWSGIDTIKHCISTFVHPKSIFGQKVRGMAINIGHPGIQSALSEYQINSLLKQMKTDSWYIQNIDDRTLNKLLTKNYTMGCGVVTFEHHEDLIDVLERSLPLLKYVMSFGYSKIKHIKSQIS